MSQHVKDPGPPPGTAPNPGTTTHSAMHPGDGSRELLQRIVIMKAHKASLSAMRWGIASVVFGVTFIPQAIALTQVYRWTRSSARVRQLGFLPPGEGKVAVGLVLALLAAIVVAAAFLPTPRAELPRLW